MSSQYNTKATSWVGNMVTRLQSVHVWCVARKLTWESFTGLLWGHADAFTDSSDSLRKIKREVAWQKDMLCLKLGVYKKGIKQQGFVIYRPEFNPTRLDSILTAYLNILAVLESFISVYTLYKTKTQVASNKHSCSHPMTGTQHAQTFGYKWTHAYPLSHLCMLHNW